MYGQVKRNCVLYKDEPQPGHRYRQIAVVEKEGQFEVRIFEGVVQTDPKIKTECSNAEIVRHRTLNDALREAERKYQRSVAAGWIPYNPYST
ncbi:MAG: hypothetical protein K6U09_12105 [Acidobacteriia bacterium]|nr:hypothetical protein [Terriglobia bacterium]